MMIKMKSLIKEDGADSLAVATNLTEDLDPQLVKDLVIIWNNVANDYWNVFRQNADRYSKMALKNGIKGAEVAGVVADYAYTDLPNKSLSLWKTLKPEDKKKYLEKAFPKNKTYVA